VLTVAHQEATRRGVPIDQEHLLAGLAAVAEGGAADLLALYGFSSEELQRALRALLPTPFDTGASADASDALLRLSERAERTLQAAEREATAPGSAAVRAEHLVLALLQVPGPVHDLLTERGLSLNRVRAAAGSPGGERARSESQEEPSPLLDHLTASAARVLQEVRQGVPRRFNHNYSGTEHLLLALVEDGTGAGARALQRLNVRADQVAAAIEFIIGRGSQPPAAPVAAFAPRMFKVLKLASDEAHRLNHAAVGTGHLLLGIVQEGQGIAAGILESLGVTRDATRDATVAAIEAHDLPPDDRQNEP
jgi:ATP-dependent Clp protease ATP-binding subunit ClpA